MSKSNPLLQDSDNDGIPDGLEDANTNSVPDRYDYARQNRAVIFASRPDAFEGGQNGELTILLPSPAPTNGTPITLHLGGNTDADYVYRLTTAGGAAISNVITFNAGQVQATISVVASNNTVQETSVRRMQAALLASPNFALSTEPATETADSGVTPKSGLHVPYGYSAIFMEGIREHAFANGLKEGKIFPANFADSSWTAFLRNKYLDSLYGVVAHELGHSPGRQSGGDDHAEKGIMESGASPITEAPFMPKTLIRFRRATSWTQ